MNLEISCIVCHTKILVDTSDTKEDGNYVACNNGHYLHIEPCLKMWLLNSENCPVCNSKYLDEISRKYSKKSQIDDILSSDEPHDEEEVEEYAVVIDKLNRAKMLLLEQKYPASLNILFDILDHDDPDNNDAKFLLGKTYFLSGRFDLSVSTLMRLVKRLYDYPMAFYYLGKNFEALGLDEKALWAYERSYRNIKQILDSSKQDALAKSKLTSILEEVVNILKKLSSEQSQ
jgi:tetratricopeptide (TPR) repeat protein